MVFALAGILAHSLFLGQRTTTALQQHLPLFSSWYEWCLLSAWLLAGAYVGLILRHSENAVGLFLLPLVLVLILIAMLMGDDARFSRDQASDSGAPSTGSRYSPAPPPSRWALEPV